MGPVEELFRQPGAWTQEVPARDKYGKSVFAIDHNAVCWCLAGAISKCYGDPSSPHNIRYEAILEIRNKCDSLAADKMGRGVYKGIFIDWNDQPKRTVEEVIDFCAELGI